MDVFWSMTPAETYMAIEAFVWRDERAQEQQMRAAWYTAALSRTKRLPSLRQFLTPPKASRQEMDELRDKYHRLKKTLDANKLVERLKK